MKPKSKENKQDFLKRCTSGLVSNGTGDKKAFAMCNLDWDNANKQRSKMSMSAPIDILTDGESEDIKRTFLITAYTGKPIERFWGTLIVDLNGISAKKKIPILREHARDRVVGSGKTWTDDNGLYADGNFSKATRDAKEVLDLADEGYPWQASMRIKAKTVKVLESKEESEVVNGHTIKGPADIWLKSEVEEVSFVSLGADSDTAAISFSEHPDDKAPVTLSYNKKTDNKSEVKKMDLTLELLAKEAPELLKDIRDAAFYLGAQTERDRVVAIMKADGDKAVTLTAIETGTQDSDAFKLFYEALKQKKADDLKGLADKATKPAGQEQLNDEEYDDGEDRRPADQKLASMGSKLAKDEGIFLADAQTRVFKENPELAKAWTPEQVQ